MRKITLLVMTIVLLYPSGYAVHVGGGSPLREVYSLPNESFVEVPGIITAVEIGRSGQYVSFDIKDSTARIHVHWRFPDSRKPEWFSDGQLVVVSGRYYVKDPTHNWEPQIVADNVRLCSLPKETLAESDVYITLIPWGAAGEVTGSCYQLNVADKRILIDCGSFINSDDENINARDGHRDSDPFHFDPSKIDALVVTHAHDDHIGRIPYLVHNGFKRLIYMTKVTAEIFKKKLPDRIKYSYVPVEKRKELKQQIESQIRTIIYGERVPILDNITATFFDAGHIPGSASIVLEISTEKGRRTITFSGDIGSGHHPFLNPLDLQSLSQTDTDTLIIESTYGAEPPRKYDHDIYHDFFSQVEKELTEKRLIIIPAFALDRTQQILGAIVQGMQDGQPPNLKIAIGGKSSCYLTQLYVKFQHEKNNYAEYFSDAFWKEQSLGNPNLWKYLRGNNCNDSTQKEQTNFKKKYNIIITPSGTGNSSLAKELLKEFIEDPNVTFFKVGWAPSDSPMGQLGGDHVSAINIDEQDYEVRANIINLHEVFSGHGDIDMLLKYVKSFPRLHTVIITHGDDKIGTRYKLAEQIRERFPKLEILVPAYGEHLNFALMTKGSEQEEQHGWVVTGSLAGFTLLILLITFMVRRKYTV